MTEECQPKPMQCPSCRYVLGGNELFVSADWMGVYFGCGRCDFKGRAGFGDQIRDGLLSVIPITKLRPWVLP